MPPKPLPSDLASARAYPPRNITVIIRPRFNLGTT